MLRYIRARASGMSDRQSGFIKSRYIGGNTRFIYDLMYYIESHNIPELLHVILINYEKAFDSISWDFIYQFFGTSILVFIL